ncbi:CHAD domain-containing protein [Mycobacterium sp. PS03-16]|uniref:CYTH and CHAD domain-containing protein n=1 Tax=Mycobacterium sp. PS03-16 TaxID=2559611 RepID=UPI0010730533|nr:CHAD domain-containing protein [Mycobacterium sp. PS03-16]TFV60259.1 CHAD domain-containing protein [Mycobacterium sp. PS03-16]
MPEPHNHWEVEPGFALEKLCTSTGAVEADDVRDTYYDTADGDLRCFGAALRRRERDGSVSWRLEAPGTEPVDVTVQHADGPPEQLVAMLTGIRHGKAVADVATVHRTRRTYRPADGLTLIDEQYRGSAGPQLLAWRRVSLAGNATDAKTARQLTRRLEKAGARQAPDVSPLQRILPARGAPDGRRDPITAYVGDQIDVIFAGDVGLRRGADPIHDTRVAIRRLRSTLRVFGTLFDPSAVGNLDDELKWFAGLLGEVRDRQVQRRRFAEVLDSWPPELVLGPVAARIDGDLLGEQTIARRAVTEAMDSPRYLELLAVLARWRTDPPVRRTDAATLSKRARRAERKADERLVAAIETQDGAQLHRARKAAKRARYAAELRAPADRRAQRTAKRYKKVQRILGDHQDSTVAADILRRLALSAGTTPGENGFTFGLLYAREQQIAHDARRKARALTG